MPRHPRFCPAGIPVHAIQRGNNRNVIFASDSDMAAYVHWLEEGAAKFEVAIHGWVLMTNHVQSRNIELNPVRAGMVTDPGHYRWSSYRVHAHGLQVSMWTAHETYLSLDRQSVQRQARYRALINEALDQEVISKIRHCASAGLVLGNENFRLQVERLRS